tara:strand:+ start:87 stop:614 length:528 start_codon:yes stop_codon:yes gene_type:complete
MATKTSSKSTPIEKKVTSSKDNDSSSVLLNDLHAYPGSTKKRRRKGRGNASGLGGECGRGHKGQKSRSGFSRRAGFEGGQNPLYKRIPKKRGFTNNFKQKFELIHLKHLNLAQFNESITIDDLIKASVYTSRNPIKFVGLVPENFSIKSIETHYISKQLQQTLEKSGCTVTIIDF